MVNTPPEPKDHTHHDVSRQSASPSPQPLYTHKFFSPEGANARKTLVPIVVLPLIYNALLLWACLGLFFGSLLKSNDITRIRVTAVNLDDGTFGESVVQGIQQSLSLPGPSLKWSIAEPGAIVGDGDAWSRYLVEDEQTWAVLQVSANASAALQDALIRGTATYNPLDAVTLYLASARNQITTMAVTLPAVMGLVNPLLSQLAVASTASFVQSNGNETSLQTALQCPQCLAAPYAVKQVDLIPFTPAVAFGTMNTGLIFLLTFTFNIFTVLRAGAEIHGHIFTLRTHLIFRTISSLSAYLFLSLMYALGVLAFSIPMTGHYSTTGSGFMVFWMLSWCTMGACGLVMEGACTIIGMQWAAFFLNIWIITNVSGGFSGFELMPGFYKYGYAMPFYHTIQATRTIIFGTKSHLGVNFGVLIAWMVVGWTGVALSMAWRIRKGKKTGVHHVP